MEHETNLSGGTWNLNLTCALLGDGMAAYGSLAFPLCPQCFRCREDGVLDDRRFFTCSEELLVGLLIIADVGPVLLMEWDTE